MSADLEPTRAGEFYGASARQLQDHFDSRRLADRLVETVVHDGLNQRQRAAIEAASYFFLATTDTDGFPDVSYKGGPAGFVRVLDDHTLRFPSYDGNGMYRSLGNIADTGRVGLLFIRQDDKASRIRIHGTAEVLTHADSCAEFHAAEAVVEVTIGRTFPNCPRYIHNLATGDLSPAVPEPGYEPPTPQWKERAEFREILPEA